MKGKALVTGLVAVCFILTVRPAIAGDHAKGERHGRMQGEGWDLEKNMQCKTKLIMCNREQLGLSAEQGQQIEDILMDMKKKDIRADAEIEISQMEIRSLMWKEPVDVPAVSAIIDKKFDLKKQKAKDLAGAYAAITAVLTDGQRKKLGDLFKACPMKGGEGQGGMACCTGAQMMPGKGCPRGEKGDERAR